MANDQNLDTQIIGTTIDIQPASFTLLNAAPVDSVNGLIGDVVLTTSEISEGTNLYYTEARVDANIAGKTTTDLAEGANLYYTDARVDARLLAGVPDIHTDQLQITGMPDHITWNTEDGTLNVPLNANVTLQVGQEETHLVRNLSGVTLNNGSVVRVTGASGNRLTIDVADNTSDEVSASTLGVMTETVGNNNAGYMTTSGLVRGLNTLAWAEGSHLWLGSNGAMTTTKPVTPLHLVQVGWVVRSHATEGSIFVHIQNGYELEELHDVLITAPATGDLLAWDAVNGYWKNQTLTALDLATKTYVDAQAHFDGQYSSLTGAPTLVSAFTNDAGYATVAYVDAQAHFDGQYSSLTGAPTLVSAFTNDAGYLTSYSETDPVFTASPAGSILAGDITQWNTAYSWGNHATQGYITGYTVTEGDVTQHQAALSITESQISDLAHFAGDLNGNNLVDNTRNYFLIGDNTQPTNGDLFSTSALYGAVNTVTEVNPDNLNLTVANGRTAKIKLTQTIGTGGANSERVRTNYDESILDTNGFDMLTGSSGRGLNAQFVNVKLNNTGLTSSSVGTITGNMTYLNQGTLTSGMTVDRLQGNLAAIFAPGVTVGDACGYRYERYGSLALTGQEYSFYSVPSGAKLYNNGPGEFTGDLTVGGTLNASINLNNGLSVSDGGNNVFNATANTISTPGSYTGQWKIDTNGSVLTPNGDNQVNGLEINLSSNGSSVNQANITTDGQVYVNAMAGQYNDAFNATHGITLWAHEWLGMTIARDNVYFGKPTRLAPVAVGTTAPVGPNMGEFWLDTSGGAGTEQLKTYRDLGAGLQWENVYDQETGTMFYDTSNSRIIVREGSSWRVMNTSAL